MRVDKLIVHAGANDIIDELPSVTSIVIRKLKSLVDDLREAQEADPHKHYALSGILPRNDPLMVFNHKVRILLTFL